MFAYGVITTPREAVFQIMSHSIQFEKNFTEYITVVTYIHKNGTLSSINMYSYYLSIGNETKIIKQFLMSQMFAFSRNLGNNISYLRH